MLTWFAIAWVEGNTFESLSIATGFPFGHYHYTMPGPRIVNVPPQIMPTYFGISYVSWTVAQAVTGHFDKPIAGWWKLIIPIAVAMVMMMWDLVTDPYASTVHGY